MKHLIYFDGKEHSVTTERKYTHVVIGQRDQAAERKSANIDALQKKPHTELTPAEYELLHKWTHEASAGRYALRVLDWYESEPDAVSTAKRFPRPEWINVQLREVAATIPYA